MTGGAGTAGHATSTTVPDTLRIALHDVCATAGLDPTGAQLIKFTNNAVFELAGAPVVIRIAGSQTARDRVPTVITVARWLAAHDMPSVRLDPRVDQPVRSGGHLATLWRQVPNIGPAPTGTDLGRILRRYHALPPPEQPLPTWRPLRPIRQRLTETDMLSDSDREFLDATCDELEDALSRLDCQLPPGPIHGDPFLGNLIPGPGGPVICDFDSAANGPREWDLTPVAVGGLRFRYVGEAPTQLAHAYGTDLTRWPGFTVLRKLRELQLVTSVVPVLRRNPALTEQWRHRFTTFRDQDHAAVWTPYR
ncbi:MAG: aminoglycoside phosphotransferase family protein [Actinobacteria bacterium]|nr:aminoglycoside phosphotransferase family protein [Actinomycetota bacterium]